MNGHVKQVATLIADLSRDPRRESFDGIAKRVFTGTAMRSTSENDDTSTIEKLQSLKGKIRDTALPTALAKR